GMRDRLERAIAAGAPPPEVTIRFSTAAEAPGLAPHDIDLRPAVDFAPQDTDDLRPAIDFAPQGTEDLRPAVDFAPQDTDDLRTEDVRAAAETASLAPPPESEGLRAPAEAPDFAALLDSEDLRAAIARALNTDVLARTEEPHATAEAPDLAPFTDSEN